jgi:hypothetical protein
VPRSFGARLALIVALGLAVRLVYALLVMRGVPVRGDGEQFHTLANQLAAGDGYVQPLRISPDPTPTADKPPLYPLALTGPSLLGLTSVAAHRVVSCLMGAVLVAGAGLLGRRVGGDRAGLIAALLAAVYPMLWVLDGSLRSESLYAPLIAFTLLRAYRVLDRPTLGRAAVLGALVGAAALTRTEALLLLVLLAVPLATLLPRGARLRTLAACCAACGIVLAPWVVRNWATFDTPLLSTNSGSLLYGANCDAAYYSGLIGTWPCYPSAVERTGDEADVAARLRRTGVDYAQDHAGRVPAVVGVRVLRAWDLWSPRSATRLEASIADRDLTAHRLGVLAYWLLLPLAAAGAFVIRRRGQPLRLLLAPLALVTIVAALGYGTTRFRVPAEVSLVVLAALALASVGRGRRSVA